MELKLHHKSRHKGVNNRSNRTFMELKQRWAFGGARSGAVLIGHLKKRVDAPY